MELEYILKVRLDRRREKLKLRCTRKNHRLSESNNDSIISLLSFIGAVLATHVDRMPLISSAIVNVAQDVDEPWPLEVIGHDGKAHNVTMEPGDMVLYESHSVLHGRPFPLKGRYYANVFIHFEPTGHTLRHTGEDHEGDVHAKYATSVKRRQGGHENDHSGLPPYIKDGTLEAQRWRQRHPDNERVGI